MNRILKIFFSFFLIFGFLQAQQNLVPNWSFEDSLNCPNTYGDFSVKDWFNPSVGWGSPDYYYPCGSGTITSTPLNWQGTQMPKSGKAYAGEYFIGHPSFGSNTREYIEVELNNTLTQNKKYCLSFFVSLSELSQYATSRVGAYLSTISIQVNNQNPINVVPQLQNNFNNYLSDEINWIQVRGLITSVGNENYLLIGNFFDDQNSDTLRVSNPSNYNGSYYYIDDVSLVEYNNAFAGNDSIICLGIKIKQNLISAFGAQYNWSVLNGDANSIDSLNVVAPTLSPTITTTYVLQKQQCGITSYDTLLVRVPNLFPAKVGNDTTICIGDTIFLNAVNNCTWCNHWWSNGTHSLQINVTPQNTSTYQFYQTDSCRTTNDAITVNIEYCKSPVIIAPNIFTPNADDINDVWQPIITNELSIQQYNLTIYNRWGLKVFEATQYNNGWDGYTTSGIECSEGTYFYIIEYIDAKTNGKNFLKGFLQLQQ